MLHLLMKTFGDTWVEMYYRGLLVVHSVVTVINIIKDDLQMMALDMPLHKLVSILSFRRFQDIVTDGYAVYYNPLF